MAMPHHTLSSEQSLHLRYTCEAAAVNIDDGYEPYSSSSRRLAESKPFEPVIGWIESAQKYGLGLLSGLTADSLIPPTPHHRFANYRLPVANSIIGGVAAMLGTLYTIEGKANPRHIHDVYFIPEDADTQLGTGCSYLQWHVEDGCHETRPDWVILFCLRDGPDVSTSIARCDDMTFSDEEQTLLKDAPITLRLDDSFRQAGEQRVKIATLTETSQGREIIYDPAYTELSGYITEQALSAVEREAERVRHDVILRAGDLLVFNNRRAIHSRSGFDPGGASRDRWIKRALVLAKSTKANWLSPGVVRA